MKRKEVVRGLERFIDDYKRYINHADCQRLYNALDLLKEQEPRVLDWNEIGTVDGAVWLEERDENEVVPGLVMQMHSAVNLDIKKDGKLHTASASRSDYGEGWRAWSARPTPEQMEETPWEEVHRET